MRNPPTEEQKDHIHWLAYHLDFVDEIHFENDLSDSSNVCVSIVASGNNYFGHSWDDIIKKMERHVQAQGTPTDHRSSEPTQEEAWEEKGV